MSSPLLDPRKPTREIRLGPVRVGGRAPIAIQSMLLESPVCREAALASAERLALAGCHAVRVAVPDREAAEALDWLAARSPIPVVADVHFDLELAHVALGAGAAGVRVNPGTQPAATDWRRLGAAAKRADACIRVGANLGSPSARARSHPDGPVAGCVADVLRTALQLADAGAPHLKLSVKASRLDHLLAANRALYAGAADLCAPEPPWPLHIGLTEAGPPPGGLVRATAGLSLLLREGLGDTVRVSLTADPLDEVHAAATLLRALGHHAPGQDVIACPGCARRRGDVIAVAQELRRRLDAEPPGRLPDGLCFAVMGCEVNGPEEARTADVGAAAAGGRWTLFARGAPRGRVEAADLVSALLRLAETPEAPAF